MNRVINVLNWQNQNFLLLVLSFPFCGLMLFTQIAKRFLKLISQNFPLTFQCILCDWRLQWSEHLLIVGERERQQIEFHHNAKYKT
jgi:hypothetical protein